MTKWQIETVSGSTMVEGHKLIEPKPDEAAGIPYVRIVDAEGQTVFIVSPHSLHYIKEIAG